MIDTIITSSLIILGWFGRELSDYWDRNAEDEQKKLDAAIMLCKDKNDCELLKEYLHEDVEHVVE